MDENSISIGACKVFFTPNTQGATEKNLGYTSGGVTFSSSTETKEVEVDQITVPLDETITKRTITVGCPFVSFNLETFQLMFPGSSIVTDATTSTKKKLVVPAEIKDSLKKYGGQLRLHLCELPDTDKSADILLPLAAPTGSNGDINFNKEDIKTLPVTFKAFAPSTGDHAGVALIIGDPSATASTL